MEFYTIGVYNTTEANFFNKLLENKIDTFCDIRQRRGVRGSKYSFVNSKKLQSKLQNQNIKYLHYLDLAPTKDIRELQKKADLKNLELKRDRLTLGHVFIEEYNNQVIKPFNFKQFITDLENINAEKIVLFCVEEQHKACHRSIVAAKLSLEFTFDIKHI
ncbi:DUF488 domain-containing protein [Cellulophaga baltica]|uniref:DUF488 domain-containing protein n=1 Tax=Cellulophaga TaxID=104264 RepID=UPI001C07904E|nr:MULTISPECIES: DUF488 domain-containing protein [Cellulophaga]MBU2996351.1 DUF488 domain-containing protein [Cellulophaga baltica]MDO6767747.1 DUF488 domain-containing protein [Cellulophaga sp. 1_MG-2023]